MGESVGLGARGGRRQGGGQWPGELSRRFLVVLLVIGVLLVRPVLRDGWYDLFY